MPVLSYAFQRDLQGYDPEQLLPIIVILDPTKIEDFERALSTVFGGTAIEIRGRSLNDDFVTLELTPNEVFALAEHDIDGIEHITMNAPIGPITPIKRRR